MKFKSISAKKNDGVFVQLIDVLNKIPNNSYVWSVLDFYGTGIAPDSLSMDDFEELIRNQPKGMIMSWDKLKEFAAGLNQTFDCLIVGAKTQDDIFYDKSKKENFFSCEVIIEAFDSTEWSYWAKDNRVLEGINVTNSIRLD